MKRVKILGALFTLLVIFLLLLNCTASAQIRLLEGKISGYVTDAQNGQPIEGVTVTVGINSYVNQTAITNSTGQYYIGNLIGNLTGITYNVTASKTSYTTISADVTLTTIIDFVPPAIQNFTLTMAPTPMPPMPTPTPTVPEISSTAVILAALALIGAFSSVVKTTKANNR